MPAYSPTRPLASVRGMAEVIAERMVVPETLRLVVVAFVAVAFVTMRFVGVRFVVPRFVAKKLVEVPEVDCSVVAKSEVEVAFEVVAFCPVKFARVEEAVAKRLVTVVSPVLSIVKSEVVANAAVDEETAKSVVGGIACPAVVVEFA